MAQASPVNYPIAHQPDYAYVPPKNKIILFGLTSIALVALIIHLVGGQGNPFLGTWKIDHTA